MTLGLKKPEIDCKKSQDNRVFVYTWYHKSKLGYITSRYKSKKKL